MEPLRRDLWPIGEPFFLREATPSRRAAMTPLHPREGSSASVLLTHGSCKHGRVGSRGLAHLGQQTRQLGAASTDVEYGSGPGAGPANVPSPSTTTQTSAAPS